MAKKEKAANAVPENALQPQKESRFKLFRTAGFDMPFFILLILVLALYVVHVVFLGGKALMGLDILNILDTLLKPLQDIILGLF